MQVRSLHRPPLLATLAALALFSVSAVAIDAAQAPSAYAETQGGIIISQADFAAQLGQPGVKVLDVRLKSEYQKAHIPGAISLPWQELSLSEVDGVRNEFAPDDVIAKRLGEAGLTYDDTLLIYDVGSLPGRAYVTLEYAGFDKIKVLDGGVTGWKGELTTDVPEIVVTDFKLDRKVDQRVDQAYVQQKVGADGSVIVDGRSNDAYQDGHIPSAEVFPTAVFLDENAALRPRSDILAELAAKGITPDQEIVSYCGSGGAASNNYLALRELGFTKITLYDGSWDEWSRDPSLTQEVSLPNYTFNIAADAGTGAHFLSEEEVKELQKDPNVVVLDVRSPSDFNAGRIPESVNVFWNATLGEDRVLKSEDELKKIYADAGVTPDKRVIVFSRGGLQLTHTFTVLSLLGFKDVQLFSGKFEGWDNSSYRKT